jgi:hypothetical protein
LVSFDPAGAPTFETRANELLVGHLSAWQRREYEQFGYFTVIGGSTGTRYRIRRANVLNVEQLSANGLISTLWCFMPKGDLPIGDVMLAQKIALEVFETDALRVAKSARPWILGAGAIRHARAI